MPGGANWACTRSGEVTVRQPVIGRGMIDGFAIFSVTLQNREVARCRLCRACRLQTPAGSRERFRSASVKRCLDGTHEQCIMTTRDNCWPPRFGARRRIRPGGESLPPIAMGPCEPGQVRKEAALSIASSCACGGRLSLPELRNPALAAGFLHFHPGQFSPSQGRMDAGRRNRCSRFDFPTEFVGQPFASSRRVAAIAGRHCVPCGIRDNKSQIGPCRPTGVPAPGIDGFLLRRLP